MLMSDDIELFKRTRSVELLRHIRTKHGPVAFSLACRAANLSRSKAKRMLNLTSGFEQTHELALKACK